MKKLSFLLVLLFFIPLCFAQKVSFSIISSSENHMIIKIDMPEYTFSDVTINNETYHRLQMNSAYTINERGVPELLQSVKSIIIPEESSPTFTLLNSDYDIVENFKLAPSKGTIKRNINPDDVPYEFGKKYQNNSFQFNNPIELSETFHLRDFHGVSIQVRPFDYNPVSQQLKVYHSLLIRIDFNAAQTRIVARHNCQEFDNIYKQYFLNYDGSRYDGLSETGEILVIAPDAFADAMQPYVKWKIRNGYPTTLVTLTTTGSSKDNIKNYISNFYDNHNLAFVVIVGDNSYFPYHTFSGEVSDNYYTEIAGDDNVPDIILGKISAENASEVSLQVNKFILYEENPPVGTHFEKFLGIASNQGPGYENEYDYEHIRNIDNILQNFTYTSGSELFEGNHGGLDESGNPTSSMVTNAVNNGVGIINYCGHGDYNAWQTTSFNNNKVGQLTNSNMLPFIISVACLNGEYNNHTCFAEAWLRASKNGQPTGAVGALMSTISQSWDEPMCGQDEMIRLLTGADNTPVKRTFGGISFNGLLKLYETFHNSTGLSTIRTWILFGDPTLQIRTAAPQTLSVSHPENIAAGSQQLTVSCPTEGARAVLTLGNTILAQGIINGGETTLYFTDQLQTSDTLHLLVSAFNYIPYQSDIQIILPNSPFLSMTQCQVNNASGEAHSGENINANLTIKNVGLVASPNFTITVSTNDPYITLLQNTTTHNSLQGNETTNLVNALKFKVAGNVPFQHIAAFNVEIIADTFITNSIFTLPIRAPKLAIGNCEIDDSQSSMKHNQRIDLNETVTLRIPLSNIGDAKTSFGSARIDSVENGLVINGSYSALVPALDENGNYTLDISVSANPDLQQPTTASLVLYYTSGFYKAQKKFTFLIGAEIEDWETASFNNYNWEVGTSNAWIITDSNPYEGNYCVRSASISNNNTSSLKLSLEVEKADSISFYYYVSCEAGYGSNLFDCLAFYINGTKKGSWAGEIDWTRAMYTLTPGSYNFEWRYTKDNWFSEGEDLAKIDYIKLPVSATPTSIKFVTSNEIDVQCYPNPTSNIVHINSQSFENQNIILSIFDIHGRLIRNEILHQTDNQISIRDLPVGVYLFNLSNENQNVKSIKIIKK